MKNFAEARTELPDSQQPETPRLRRDEIRTTERREQTTEQYEKRSRELLKASRELDQELHFLIGGDLKEKTELLQAMDTMTYGDELDREHVGHAGVNSITLRTYSHIEGPEPIAVPTYVKPRSGEAAYRYDPTTGRTFKSSYIYNKKSGTMDLYEELLSSRDTDGNISVEKSPDWDAWNEDKRSAFEVEQRELYEALEYRASSAQRLKEGVARQYGIAVESVPLSETGTLRHGVEANGTAVREYAASRIDQLFGFDVVPLTVLRKEHDGQDVASVQEAVQPSGKERIGGVTWQMYFGLKEQGKNHPAAASLMRVACLDYLLQSLDRHPNNLLFDPNNNTFKAIDNGFCMGLSAKEETRFPDGRVETDTTIVDSIVSVPLEIVDKQADWEIDNELHGRLSAFYESALQYEAFKDRMSKETDPMALRRMEQEKDMIGGEYKFFSKIFRMVHQNENIAKTEAMSFLRRLKHLVDNRRPPNLHDSTNGKYRTHESYYDAARQRVLEHQAFIARTQPEQAA